MIFQANHPQLLSGNDLKKPYKSITYRDIVDSLCGCQPTQRQETD